MLRKSSLLKIGIGIKIIKKKRKFYIISIDILYHYSSFFLQWSFGDPIGVYWVVLQGDPQDPRIGFLEFKSNFMIQSVLRYCLNFQAFTLREALWWQFCDTYLNQLSYGHESIKPLKNSYTFFLNYNISVCSFRIQFYHLFLFYFVIKLNNCYLFMTFGDIFYVMSLRKSCTIIYVKNARLPSASVYFFFDFFW